MEAAGVDTLTRALGSGQLFASQSAAVVSDAEHVVITVGTPIDEHLSPEIEAVSDALLGIADCLRDGQLLVLRSTVYPGVTRRVQKVLADLGLSVDVAFCPERI